MRLSILFILALVPILFFAFSHKVFAHCDTLGGPVIKDARVALEKGDVTPVLKWVKQENEREIREAFATALAERKADKAADMKFFETLVRIHRAGEGAPFSGLKPSASVEPVMAAADKALETGTDEPLLSQIIKDLRAGVDERFKLAYAKSKHKNDSVAAGREYVAAYVEYVHYVEKLHSLISRKGGHHRAQDEELEE